MKLRKALATMLAVALAVSPMTVSASELSQPGSANIDVEGGATYVDTTVYKVTLPTTNSLNFTLDPSGIFGYVKDPANASATAVDSTTLTGYKGKIVGVGAHNIVNKSSVPIAVNCAYTLSTTASDVTFTTDTTLNQNTISGNNICLKVVAGTATVSGNEVTNFAKGTYEKALAANATTGNDVTVLLGAADYEYTISGNNIGYEPKSTGTTEDSAALSIDGFISPDHDWTELASGGKKVKLGCVYSFKGVKDSSAVASGDITDKVVTANADKIVYLDGSGSGSSNTLTGTYSKASSSLYAIDLGFTPSSVILTSSPSNTSQSTELNSTTHYVMEGTTFKLRKSWTSTLKSGGTYVLKLSDGSTTKTLTLSITD